MFISKIRAVARFIWQFWPLAMVVGLAQSAMFTFDWTQLHRPLIHPWIHAVLMALLMGIPSTLALWQTASRFRQGEASSPWLAITGIAVLLAIPASSGQSIFSATTVVWFGLGFILSLFLKGLCLEWLECERLKAQSQLLTELDGRFAIMERDAQRSPTE